MTRSEGRINTINFPRPGFATRCGLSFSMEVPNDSKATSGRPIQTRWRRTSGAGGCGVGTGGGGPGGGEGVGHGGFGGTGDGIGSVGGSSGGIVVSIESPSSDLVLP